MKTILILSLLTLPTIQLNITVDNPAHEDSKDFLACQQPENISVVINTSSFGDDPNLVALLFGQAGNTEEAYKYRVNTMNTFFSLTDTTSPYQVVFNKVILDYSDVTPINIGNNTIEFKPFIGSSVIKLNTSLMLSVIWSNPLHYLVSRFPLSIKTAPITVKSSFADINTINSKTCLEIVLANPCVNMDSSDFLTLEFDNDSLSALDFFDSANCDVYLNDQPATADCYKYSDRLKITNIFPDKFTDKEMTVKVCDIKMQNFNDSSIRIHFDKLNSNSLMFQFAAGEFNVDTDLGVVMIPNKSKTVDTGANTVVLSATLKLMATGLIRSNSRVEVDFGHYSTISSSASYSYSLDNGAAVTGTADVHNNKFSFPVSTSINLIKPIEIELAIPKDLLPPELNEPVVYRIYSRDNNLVYETDVIFDNVVSTAQGYFTEKDVGVNGELHLTVHDFTPNGNPYNFDLELFDLAEVDSNLLEVVFSNKHINPTSIVQNTNNNKLTVSSVDLDSSKTSHGFTFKGIKVGPFHAGNGSMVFTIKQNNEAVFQKAVDFAARKNSITIEEVTEEAHQNGYRITVNFSYRHPFYGNHYARIGLPSHYIVDPVSWNPKTQIPLDSPLTISALPVSTGDLVHYYKVYNLFKEADCEQHYQLSFNVQKEFFRDNVFKLEMSVFSDHPAIALDDGKDYSICETVLKDIEKKCPLGCKECSTCEKCDECEDNYDEVGDLCVEKY